MAMMLLLFSCSTEVKQPEIPTEQAVELLPAAKLLSRASLDLRGVRPSLEELEQIESNPGQLNEMMGSFLQDPRFGSRVRALFSEVYLTRQDVWDIPASEYGLASEADFAAAIGEEPLQMVSYIAEHDLPYTDLVTADWTMANETLAVAWPVDYPEGESGWQQVHYTDGRPQAGVLSTNGFWWHYGTNFSNSNRGRANALSKILLCNDYLSRPIEFSRDVNLLDREALEDALKNNEGCYACHSSLDPFASYLWGFYYLNTTSRLDATTYHPERERIWQETSEIAPGYYGEPGNNLEDLGWQIASDDRFPSCLVQHSFERLMQRESTLEDTEQLSLLRNELLSANMTIKPLFQAILLSQSYQAADHLKLVGPELLATEIEGITGFRMTTDGYDMMTTDTYGLRLLSGGVNGGFVTSPTTTMVLVQERMAQAGADFVVQQDSSNRAEPRLFTEVDPNESAPDSAAMARQFQKLRLRVFGERYELDSAEIQEDISLWQELLAAEGNPKAAWAGMLSVLMRDPAFLTY